MSPRWRRSGLYGKTLACAGIVSTAELLFGSDVGRVLDAHMAAGGSRFKGIQALDIV